MQIHKTKKETMSYRTTLLTTLLISSYIYSSEQAISLSNLIDHEFQHIYNKIAIIKVIATEKENRLKLTNKQLEDFCSIQSHIIQTLLQQKDTETYYLVITDDNTQSDTTQKLYTTPVEQSL